MMIMCLANIDYSLLLTFMFGSTIILVFSDIAISLFIILENNHKRKQFVLIKNNGSYFDGVIISAYRYIKPRYARGVDAKNTGEILVTANNKTYTITDIDYNDAFKDLEQKLNDNFYINKQKIIDKDRYFKNTGILSKINSKEITVGIYILDNKVIADFDTIKCN